MKKLAVRILFGMLFCLGWILFKIPPPHDSTNGDAHN